MDPKSPILTDSLWVLSYSVIFGVLGALAFITGVIFVPMQLLCKVFSKNVEEYSWIDRFITRVMLTVDVILIFPLTVVGLWATSAFYFNVDDPITNIHDQTWVLKQKYDLYYTNAEILLQNTPPYDIMPAEPINEFHQMISNGTTSLSEALDFMDTWVIRGAFGGLIPYTAPLLAVVFTMVYVVRGRRLMYVVALLTTLLSLICLMGVAIPNSAWAVLVSFHCTSGVHTNAVRYLQYYNPNSCVPDVVESYVWMDPINRTACMPEPWSYTQNKIDSVQASGPTGPAALYFAAAKQAWSVISDLNRTNIIYNRVLDETCDATANRGATLFLSTLLLQVYLLLHMYVILFSTMRLKPPKLEEYNKFHDEVAAATAPESQEMGTVRSNIRERLEQQRHVQGIDNSNVFWTLLGYLIVHGIMILLLSLGYGIGAEKVTIVDP